MSARRICPRAAPARGRGAGTKLWAVASSSASVSLMPAFVRRSAEGRFVEGAVTRGATPREVLLLLNISEFGLVTVRHLVPYYYFYYPRGPRHVEALY